MLRAPRVGDNDDENAALMSKIRLTRNEYHAAVRNKIEYNRLKVLNRHFDHEIDARKCKLQTTIYDLKQELDENQQVVCNVREYFINRKVQSANLYRPSRPTDIRSKSTRRNLSARVKSASTTYRPLTTLLQTPPDESYIDHEDAESADDEVSPISDSRSTSSKQQLTDLPFDILTPITSNYRITWPVQMKVFAIQDENEKRHQLLAWRADQQKLKARRSSKELSDPDLERKYRESIRRRKEIESFATSERIEEHQLNDPVFAKRYQQLKLAIRAGKTPIYDPNDRDIHTTTNQSKIERTRTALITAKQNKVKSFYQNQQKINDAKLSNRVDHFLERLAAFKQQTKEERY